MSNFDDPFAPADGTVLRPRPGGSRRGGEPVRGPVTQMPDAGHANQAPIGNASVNDFVVGGRNAILLAAAPLLAIASRLQSMASHPDVPALRNQAIQEVHAFEERLRASGVVPDDAKVARYLLCTFFDSAVLNTPWGAQSDWSGQPLLVIFHKEKTGGEKFFQILETISAQPGRYIDLIELQFVCLSLGYEGMYRIQDRGQLRLVELQHSLYRIIRDTRQLREEELSAHWHGVEDRRNPVLRFVPWWIVAVSGLALLVIAFVVFNVRLSSAAASIKEVLSRPSIKVEYTPPPVKRANRLKQILAPEEQARQLTVEDFGDKTIVTLIATNLFRSGSAEISTEYVQTLQAVARGLNQVPGKVVVVGHTDDQPLRSLQFADNFELSRERAVQVVKLLKPILQDPGRIEFAGVGASQPRYRPANTAENRALNRRVEVISLDGVPTR
jgi:type VI secretion system protein ImpK